MKANKIIILSLILVILSTFAIAEIIEPTPITKDDVFTELKDNDEGRTESIITIDNPEISTLNKEALTITFKEICGKVKSYEIQTLQDCTTTIDTHTIQEVCSDIYNNETKKTDSICEDKPVKTGTKQIITPCWKKAPYIYSGMKDYKIVADIKPENCEGKFGYKIDWIPELTINDETYIKEEWAWWNATWNDKYQITINNTDVKVHEYEIIEFNQTFLKNTSCYTDLNSTRIIKSDTTIIPYEWRYGTNRSKGFWFINNDTVTNGTTNTAYYIYCNATGVDKGNTTIFEISDDKDENTTNLWSNMATGGRAYPFAYNTTTPIKGYGSFWHKEPTNFNYLYRNITVESNTPVYLTTRMKLYVWSASYPRVGMSDSSICKQAQDATTQSHMVESRNGNWDVYDGVAYQGITVPTNATADYIFTITVYDLDQADSVQNLSINNREVTNNTGGRGITDDIGCVWYSTDNGGSQIITDDMFVTIGQPITQYNNPSKLILGDKELADAVTNTSILASHIDVADFNFSSNTYITGINVTFNTSKPESNLTILSSMNIEKISVAGTTTVSANITVDGKQISEENLRTLTNIGDEGSTGLSPTTFNVSAGTHELIVRFKRTNAGIIEVNDIDFTLIEMTSALNYTIKNQNVDLDLTFTNTTIANLKTCSRPKTFNSSTAYITKFSVQKSAVGSSNVSIRYENNNTAGTTPYIMRHLATSTSIGSMSLPYVEETFTTTSNMTLQGMHTDAGETITINGTGFSFDLGDENNNTIIGYQGTNKNTNTTNYLDYVAGTTLVYNKTVELIAGNGFLIMMTTSFKSESGVQTPTYYLNITNTTCTSKKERYLTDNDDIGNAFIYHTCNNLTANNYTINLYIKVPAGETIRQLDESINIIETSQLDTATSNLPPISNGIIFPENNTAYFPAIYNITINPSSDPNGDEVRYNYTLYLQTGAFNQTLAENVTNTTIKVNISSPNNYTITVTSFDQQPSDWGAWSNQSNDFFILGCNESWTAVYGSCLINDSRLKTYNDTNACGTVFNLPADNGTYEACNYCSEDLTQVTTNCTNGTQNVSWIDNNFATCCFLTNITADCSILYDPFNVTTTQNCTTGNLINNFTCQYDTKPYMKDKINVVCEMPDNETYCCVINTIQDGELVATCPEYQDASTSLLSLRSEEETRTCFTPQQRLLNGYYTTKSLITDRNFRLQVLCTSNNKTIRSEYFVAPMYSRPDWFMGRYVWLTRNIFYVIGALFSILLVVLLLGYYYRKFKGR